jgi:hypothetical protein
MSMIFGILFILAGLALAVFLGIVLYREPEKKLQPHEAVLRTGKDPKTA